MSILSFVYLAVVALLVVSVAVLFCLEHPQTAKTIAMCTLFVTLFLLSVVFVPALADEADVYPLTAVVTEIDVEEDLVTVEDGSGTIWCFYGIEDYQVGDVVSMLMWEAGTTDYIEDDEVLDVVYSGFTTDMFY